MYVEYLSHLAFLYEPLTFLSQEPHYIAAEKTGCSGRQRPSKETTQAAVGLTCIYTKASLHHAGSAEGPKRAASVLHHPVLCRGIYIHTE